MNLPMFVQTTETPKLFQDIPVGSVFIRKDLVTTASAMRYIRLKDDYYLNLDTLNILIDGHGRDYIEIGKLACDQ